MDIADVQPVHS